MGLKHEAKKGTVIEISGPAKITVLRGSTQLDIDALPEVSITTTCMVTRAEVSGSVQDSKGTEIRER